MGDGRCAPAVVGLHVLRADRPDATPTYCLREFREAILRVSQEVAANPPRSRHGLAGYFVAGTIVDR
jgi:hypothetical protein